MIAKTFTPFPGTKPFAIMDWPRAGLIEMGEEHRLRVAVAESP
jgi:hypothetical protein